MRTRECIKHKHFGRVTVGRVRSRLSGVPQDEGALCGKKKGKKETHTLPLPGLPVMDIGPGLRIPTHR